MSSRLHRYRALGTAALALTLVTTAGCASGSPAPGPAPDTNGSSDTELTSITVGALPIANFAYLYLGVDQGFFEEEGLDLSIEVAGTGSELIAGAVSGAYDIIGSGYVPAFTAISQGIPLRIIAAGDVGANSLDEAWTPVSVGADSDITTPEQVATSVMATNALKGVVEVTVRASLEKLGIDSSQLTLVEVPFPEMGAALENGTVDSAYTVEPFLQQVKEAGGHPVYAPYMVLGEDFPNGGWQAMQSMIDQDPDTVDAFIRAINKSTEYAASHPDEVRGILPTFTRMSPEVIESMNLPRFTSNLNEPLLEDLLQYTEKYGVIEEMPVLKDIIYRPAA